LLRTCT